MNKNFVYGGILIAIVIAIGGYLYPILPAGDLGAATRFPNGYLDTGDGYYVDGSVIIDGSGNLSVGTLAASGASTLTATTTLSDGVQLRNTTGLCFDFYATSSATTMKLVASSTSLVNGVSTGVMLISYGACAI